MTFFEIILLLVSAQGFFLSAILWISKKGNRESNRLLSSFIAVASYYLFYLWLYNTFYIQKVPHLISTSFLFVPLFAPLFYLYLRSIEKNSARHKWPHFIPFLLQILYYIPFLLSSAKFKAEVIMKVQHSDLYNATSTKILTALHVSLFAYYVWRIFKESKDIDLDTVRKRWKKASVVLFTTLAISYSMGVGFGQFLNLNFPDYLFIGLIALTVYGIGYYGYTHQELVFNIQPVKNEKYRNSNLSKSESEMQFEKVHSYISKEKSFLNFNLKLEGLAEQLALPSHAVSQAINQNTGKNFSEFLNEFRIEEAKKLLESNTNAKMLAIAYDSGFGNKVSFYKNFRKHTGFSPAEYKTKYQENQTLTT